MNEPGGYEWLQGVGSSSGAFHWWGQRCLASIGYLILDLLSHCFLLVVTCWELEQAHNSSVMLIRGAETSQGDSITQVWLWCCHLGYKSLLEIFKITYSINSHIFLAAWCRSFKYIFPLGKVFVWHVSLHIVYSKPFYGTRNDLLVHRFYLWHTPSISSTSLNALLLVHRWSGLFLATVWDIVTLVR